MADEKSVQLAINTIRTLSTDAVQQANSGHPGTPMTLAPVAYCLGQHFLRFEPDHPIWPNWDRFVLSKGISMVIVQYQLDEGFEPYDVKTWYHNAAFGDMAVISLPKRACKVRLIRGYRDSVCWWPEDGRSITISVENAMARLAMLQVRPRS